MFILQRKAGLTHEQCMAHWSGDQHVALVRRIPGLTKWMQNHILPGPGVAPCDGIGELWFESDEALQRALGSPEMGAAVEDAKQFLDLEKTNMIQVEERMVVDSGTSVAHNESAT